MKKLLLPCLLFIFNTTINAQEKLSKDELIGVWKIHSISAEKGLMYCDLQKDSIFVSDELKKTWATGEDTMMAMGALKLMVGMMKELKLSFTEQGQFIENNGRKPKEGSYTFNESNSILVTKTKSEQTFKATMEKGMLKLIPEGESKVPMIMYLDKTTAD